MSAPTPFIRSLLRVAKLQGRAVLEAIVTSQFSVISDTGGKQLTGVAAGGKSFTYTVPQGLQVHDLMGKAEEALTLFDSLTEDQLDNLLTRRPIHTTRAGF